MEKVNPFVLMLFAASTLIGCGVTQPVRTIDEGRTDLIVSFGGPIIPFDGFAIPAPYINTGIVYGMTDDLALYGNGHITAALFKDIGLDGGAVVLLLREEGMQPELTLNGRLYFFWDVGRANNARVFPMGSLIASYAIGDRSLFYFGMDNLYQVHQPELFIAPLVGYQFPLSNTVDSQIEFKWLAANKDTRHGVFEGATSIAGNGGAGLFLGFQYRLE
jgi:hypothetical protein